LLPALYYAKQDSEREKISEADAEFVAHATREIVEELDRPSTATRDTTATEGSLAPRRLLFLCPARDEIDGVPSPSPASSSMRLRWQVEILGPSMLTSRWRSSWTSAARRWFASGRWRRVGVSHAPPLQAPARAVSRQHRVVGRRPPRRDQRRAAAAREGRRPHRDDHARACAARRGAELAGRDCPQRRGSAKMRVPSRASPASTPGRSRRSPNT
jgi:hypothetical protein